MARRSTVLLSLVTALLAACAQQPPTPPAPIAPLLHDPIAAIRAAGEKETSVIDVKPLSDPGVTALREAAQVDERTGRYADAAAKLEQALKRSPQSPDLLQERAEAAIYLKDYVRAERLAHESWSLGPRLGPLCARNWQTIVEMRLIAHDEAGAASARKGVPLCHEEGVPRY